MSKSIQLRSKTYIVEQWPLICAPLVARELPELLGQAKLLETKAPDLVEWRIDFFNALNDTAAMLEALRQLRQLLGEIPLLVTRRSIHEGGEPITLDEGALVELYQAMVETGYVDMLDYELSQPEKHWQQVKQLCEQQAIPLIGSYHNFAETPATDELVDRFVQAAEAGADIAKVAVMPVQREDVLRLLMATSQADSQLTIPVISMSMARLGLTTRLVGAEFGSCLTFAVGDNASAPGQVPIAEVRSLIEILHSHS